MGIVALAREDYSQALESLRHAGYDEDAAYLAERVLSTDELLNHVRQFAPNWQLPVIESNADEDPPLPSVMVEPANCLGDGLGTWSDHFTTDNSLRWQLARRLAREGRLLEAGEFLPPTLKKLWDHYLTLDREKRSGHWTGEALAAILWRQARIHRFWGAELFSTDSIPDGGIRGWSFEASDLAAMRTSKQGKLEDWQEEILHSESEDVADQAVPAVLADELTRAANHRPPNENRFHYRYVAADLAMEAAKQLPDNHPQLAPLLNTAGLWLAAANPSAADPFYQTLVKRCKETEIGQAADRKRWFIRGADPMGEFPSQAIEIIPAAAPNQ
jgi:hypothetical protein